MAVNLKLHSWPAVIEEYLWVSTLLIILRNLEVYINQDK